MPNWGPLSRRNTLRLTKQWGMHSFRGQFREILTGFIPTIPLTTHYLPDEERWFAGTAPKATNVNQFPVPNPPGPPIPAGSFLLAGTELTNPLVSGHDIILHRVEAVVSKNASAGLPFFAEPVACELHLFTQWPDMFLGGDIYRAAAIEPGGQATLGLMSGIGEPASTDAPSPGQIGVLQSGLQLAGPHDILGRPIAGIRMLNALFFGSGAATGSFTYSDPMPPIVIEPGGSVAVQPTTNFFNTANIPPTGTEIRLTTNWFWRVRPHV